MLHAEHLAHHFASAPRVAVLAELSLSIADGEFVSVIGPSGCGKSTLLHILAGLVTPDSGRVELDGESIIGLPGAVAYMPQRDLLLPWRRAIDNAILAAEIDGGDAAAARARALALFESFGLAGFENAWPSELSGGMRQRLALLRTFLFERNTLLLDEPFGALDAITRRGMHAWMQGVWMADRRSVLFVTHDVDEAILLSDRVLVMTNRPGMIAATIDISEPHPRPSAAVLTDWFVAYKSRLLEHLERAMLNPADVPR